ncbi:MAG TPA: IPT/TIG domain-containing protein [Bryobacteraceae bacterium]|nr:IPT/TIG domain-containing protein [Bryobacteraceae bacterium]
MQKMMLKIALLLIPFAATAAVPSIQYVSDSASYGPRIAPGSLATIFGSDLSGDTDTATDFPISTILAGTTVSVAGTLAPLLYVSPTQINFQVPSGTAVGSVKIVVNGPGGASAAFSFTVTAQAPSLFQYGSNHALAQNSDGVLNSAQSPASAGSWITVYLTGQGSVDNPVPDGAATPLSPIATATAKATATIGPATATVQFLGLTPDFAGLAQANIQVPNSLPTGDYPLVITAGNYIGASAIVSVSGSGTAYKTPLTLTSSTPFLNPHPYNVVLLGNLAYVCGSDRIVIVDVTRFDDPVVTGSFGDNVLNGAGNRCALSTLGTTPLLVDIVGSDTGLAQSLAVFNLSNPVSPGLLTLATTPYGHMEDISFTSIYAVVTTSYITYSNTNAQIVSQQGDFLVFSFLNPANPIFVTSLPPGSGAGMGSQFLKPWAEIIDNAYAYVATTTATGTSTQGAAALSIADLTIPSAPTPLIQISVPQAAILLSFDVSGTTLLAAGNTAGQRNPGVPDFDFVGYLTLTSMDVTNPIAPSVISTLTTQLQVNGTFYTSAFNNGIFAIVNKPPASDNFGPSSMMIVNARNPASMTLVPFQTQFGFSGMVTTTNGYLFAPTTTGLNIYQLQL